MNSGVILFKSTTPVLAFLRAWQQAYHSAGFKKDQVTLRELLWGSDLRLISFPRNIIFDTSDTCPSGIPKRQCRRYCISQISRAGRTRTRTCTGKRFTQRN